MNRLSCHQTSIQDRVTMVGRYLGRTRKQGTGHLVGALVTPATWLKLMPNKQALSVPVGSQSLTQLSYASVRQLS